MAKKINFKLKHLELLLLLLIFSIGAFVLYILHNKSNKQEPTNISTSQVVNSNKVLMLFYAEWCGYSRQFLPVWDEIVESSNIQTQKIDVDENSKLANQFKISTLPTLYLVEGNIVTKYEGPRTKNDILKFISKQ